jgi:hypothetical protein
MRPGAAELPIEVGELGNFEARMLRNFRAAVEDWEEVCSSLGRWESEHFTAEDSEHVRTIHRKWVNELLSWGQLVSQATGHPAFPDQTLSTRVAQRIRHLQDKLALWHTDMTPADEERVMRKAFA